MNALVRWLRGLFPTPEVSTAAERQRLEEQNERLAARLYALERDVITAAEQERERERRRQERAGWNP